jgi:hypothetical protein
MTSRMTVNIIMKDTKIKDFKIINLMKATIKNYMQEHFQETIL